MGEKGNGAFRVNYFILGLAVGVGAGVSIGTAMKNPGVGLAIGAGLGLVLGYLFSRNLGKKQKE